MYIFLWNLLSHSFVSPWTSYQHSNFYTILGNHFVAYNITLFFAPIMFFYRILLHEHMFCYYGIIYDYSRTKWFIWFDWYSSTIFIKFLTKFLFNRLTLYFITRDRMTLHEIFLVVTFTIDIIRSSDNLFTKYNCPDYTYPIENILITGLPFIIFRNILFILFI